jgi:pimeloyl-ACP methyl ester carboxylesterase
MEITRKCRLSEGEVLCRAMLWDDAVFGLNREVRYGWRLKPQLTMPAMIVVADSDKFLSPSLLQGVGDVAPNAIVRVLPRCSHWMQQDAAADITALLNAFLGQ